jgi:hypothetical protein
MQPITSMCALGLMLLLAACGSSKAALDLSGTYKADYEFATEKLTLNHDGTCTQEVTLKSTSKVDVAKGTWTYDPTSGYITLDGKLMLVMNGLRQLRPGYASPADGRSVLPVSSGLGQTSIGTSEGVLYKKL